MIKLNCPMILNEGAVNRLPPAGFKLWVVLAMRTQLHKNELLPKWYDLAEMVRDTRMAPQTVERWIKRLIDRGLLARRKGAYLVLV